MKRTLSVVVGLGLLSLSCWSHVYALSLGDVKLNPEVLAPGCIPLKGQHPVSAVTKLHYQMIDGPMYEYLVAPLDKAYQSFKCGKVKSTIYYFEYGTRADLEAALGFTRGHIWGGDGPSARHPEAILDSENVLIIISSREPSFYEKHFRPRP